MLERIKMIMDTKLLSNCNSCGFAYMDCGISFMDELVPCPKCKSPLNLESEDYEFDEFDYDEI